MKINLDDKYLDRINKISQTDSDANSNELKLSPVGKNSLKSFALFYQRKNYELGFNLSLQNQNKNEESFKDLIYAHTLYGKINNNNQAINLKKQSLKALESNTKLEAINFVADAFNDLFMKHKLMVSRGNIPKESAFYDIKPKLAFESPNKLYNNHLNKFTNDMMDYFQKKEKFKNIIDFKTFVDEFIYYFDNNISEGIFAKSTWLLSSMCTPASTGLIIEIAKEKHSNDQNKYEKYVKDESFTLFDDMVKDYGFCLDRHAPWRLVFDIESPNARKYLDKYNITNIEDLHKKYYNVTEETELDILKITLLNSYNYIANLEPTFSKFATNTVNENVCISNKFYNRKIISENDVYKNIPEDRMLKLYFYTKTRESNLKLSQSSFEQKFSEILIIKQARGLKSAIFLINDFCRNINLEPTQHKDYRFI